MKLQPFFFSAVSSICVCIYVICRYGRSPAITIRRKTTAMLQQLPKKGGKNKNKGLLYKLQSAMVIYIYFVSPTLFLFCFKWMSRGVGQGTGPTVSFNCRTTRLSLFLTLPSTLLSFRAFPNFLQTQKKIK